MICHSCRHDGVVLLIRVDQAGIPPGQDGHDIAYSHTLVFSCPRCGGSQIEIHNHDCFDQEDLFDRYEWYLLGPADTGELRALVQHCPARLSPECQCPLHHALRATCRSLPSTAWIGRADEPDFHVHRASLDMKNGRPTIATERNGS